MAETTIEWTRRPRPDGSLIPGYTFNPWIGCAKVAPGCKNCYAEAIATRFKKAEWGPEGTRIVTSPKYWEKPERWNAAAEAAGERRIVFCASMADVFEDWQGPMLDANGNQLFTINGDEFFSEAEYPECRPATMADVRQRLFDLIDATPWLDWLLLTKRPENLRQFWPAFKSMVAPFPGAPGGLGAKLPCWTVGAQRPNVWLGTSCSDQETADTVVPALLTARDLAPVLFLSAEPLLGPIDIARAVAKALGCSWPPSNDGFVGHEEHGPMHRHDLTAWIDWVIAGGESGRGARGPQPEWIRQLRNQCDRGRIPFYFKQWGTFGPRDASDTVYRLGKGKAGRTIDGHTYKQFPTVGEPTR